MSENRKMIKYYLCFTLFCLLLTYVFSLSVFSSPCLNSNFLTVVFGGLFGSFGVMLLAEIRKYFLNKRTAEDQLFFAFYQLYNHIIAVVKTIETYQKKPNETVPENLCVITLPLVEKSIRTLRFIDYCPYRESIFTRCLKEYKASELPSLEKHVNICRTELQLSIYKEKIRSLRESGISSQPVSSNPVVNSVLCMIKTNAEERIYAICKIQEALSSYSNNRYDWNKEKAQLDAIEINIPDSNP